MFDFEEGRTPQGVPGLEGGKEPDHTTASRTIAESNIGVWDVFAAALLFSETQKGNTSAMQDNGMAEN